MDETDREHRKSSIAGSRHAARSKSKLEGKGRLGPPTNRDHRTLNILGTPVHAIVGCKWMDSPEIVVRLERIIRGIPESHLIASRGTRGVDELVEKVCARLGRRFGRIEPVTPMPKWPFKDRMTWYAIRDALVGKRATVIHVLMDVNKTDNSIQRILNSARKNEKKVVIEGGAEQATLFEVKAPKRPRKKRSGTRKGKSAQAG